MLNKKKSRELFEEANRYIPGGVNSPARAFKAVGGDPVFIRAAEGAYMIDQDDNRYIELINSWGPMILGHANKLVESAIQEALTRSTSFGAPTEIEVKMARLISGMIPSIEKVRMVNSGTEATMSAVRVARGYTGRDKIIKFEGCYHGHGDSFLISAGSGAATMGEPDSPGVTKAMAKDTLTARFNDLDSVRNLVDKNPEGIAALIVEPVAGNMGCILPVDGFLEGLREICDEYGIILIFDEVMTGFRLSRGGAQEMFGIKPDLTTLGKIIGGGMPVGAYGGKAEIMDQVSPAGPVYQAGTLSGNPIAMHAGYALLSYLQKNPSTYKQLDEITGTICKGIEQNLKDLSLEFSINRAGSMFTLFFNENPVNNFDDAGKSDLKAFGEYFNRMLGKGVYLAPSQFETLFVSTAIGKEEAEKIIQANADSLKEMYS